jgi:hypothetical protein
MGPVTETTDCEALGQVCVDGTCAAPTCEPGKRFCQGEAVYFCVDGVSSLPYAECKSDELCDPELAACAARICEPGSRSCEGQRIVTCSALGTAYLHDGANCQANGQVCVEGQCLPRVCEPQSYFCQGSNELRQCNETGTGSTAQICPSYTHCGVGVYGAGCLYNTCTPNQAACVDNAIVTCNADGSGYTSAPPKPCGDALCQNGACQPKVCDGYKAFCKDGDVYQCQGSLASTLWTQCGGEATCKPAGTSVSCKLFSCVPGFKACLQNQLGACASDGFSLSSVTRDCASEGLLCVSDAACGAQALDSLGSTEELDSFASGQLIGDVVEVTSDRVLTKLEASLVLAGTRDLRFSVFELVGGYFEPRYDKVVRQEAASGWLGSGELSYPLRAGRRYLFAVSATLGGFVGSYDLAPFPRGPSFGRNVGGLAATYSNFLSDSSNPNRAYALRISTSPP